MSIYKVALSDQNTVQIQSDHCVVEDERLVFKVHNPEDNTWHIVMEFAKGAWIFYQVVPQPPAPAPESQRKVGKKVATKKVPKVKTND